jgi:hypothetical protein
VDQFWCHEGIFSSMGVIASVISYYICWVWLIEIHFQIINFNIYMVQFFFNAKNIKSQELWTFEIEKSRCNANYN